MPQASPAFGPATATALLAGVSGCLLLPALPAAPWFVLAGVVGAILWWRHQPARLAGAFLCGFALAGLHAGSALADRLPHALEGRDVVVTGRVVELPRREPGRTRFRLRVDGDNRQLPPLRGKLLRLSWYDPWSCRADPWSAGLSRARRADHGSALQGEPTCGSGGSRDLAPGSRWQLTLKLRAPRGLRNPGTIDTEKRALAEGIAATGYVRAPETARQLAPSGGIDAWRARMSARIGERVASDASRFLQALALGDTRQLTDEDWASLRAAGLTHLIAISGFHVGLVAGFCALLAAAVWWLFPTLGRRLPRMHAAAIAALLGAAGYAAVAGFALPTVRTVLMIGLVVLARLLRRAQRMADALALAAIATLLVDPLAVLSAGFWLSFAGVAWLLWCLPNTGERGWRATLRGFFGAQAVATLGLLPFTVVLFGQASLAGPFANLLAIPWWSLVVVPLALAGTALEWVHAGAGAWPWQWAAQAFDLTWPVFEAIADSPLAFWWLPEPAWFALPLALLGGFWLMLPRGVPGKPLALLLWLPLLWPQRGLPSSGEVQLVVLDVGQGLSVLVRTAGHTLLYDMGPGQPGGFDAGASVVVPALHALGVRRLDAVVVSHADNDHSGGFGAVVGVFPPNLVFLPEGMPPLVEPTHGRLVRPATNKKADHGSALRRCGAPVEWAWDGVHFQFLHPPRWFPYLDNDSSCVLRIEAGGRVALLPGDIGKVVESGLVKRQAAAIRADVVVAAHHGSAHSSSSAFVDATRARWVLVSAGYANRFGHPATEVVARWEGAGAEVVETAEVGAEFVGLGAMGVTVRGERGRRRRVWDAVAASAPP